MKKIVTILLVLIMVLGVLTTVVNAATSSTLADEIYSIGKEYGMTEANRVKIERYLSENPVTDEEADSILAKAEEVADIFDAAGVTDYSELSEEDKEEVKSIAVETGSIIDLTVVFGTNSVEVYKEGKLVETVNYNDGDKLLYTGNNYTPIIVVSSVVVIALLAGFALRKKFANA